MKNPRIDPMPKKKKETREEKFQKLQILKKIQRLQQIEQKKAMEQQNFAAQMIINPKLHHWERHDCEVILEELEKTKSYITPIQNQHINRLLIPQTMFFNKTRTADELQKIYRFNQVIRKKYCDNCEAPVCCYIYTDSGYTQPCIFFNVQDRQCRIYENRPYACKVTTCNKIGREEVLAIFQRLGITNVNLHSLDGE